MTVKLIVPYVNENEIKAHKNIFWDLDVYYEKDTAGIGSDMMYKKCGNNFLKTIYLFYTLT